jgi:site-specific DNA-methyltransferase (adenine-specific)
MNNLELNKIYCESNLETMARIPNGFIDVVITSPPYNLGNRINGGFNKKKYDKYKDNISKEEYFLQTKIWIDELLRVTKHHIFWNVQEVTGNKGLIKFLLNEYSDKLKETFIWAKQNPPSSIVDTMCSSGYEYIFCFSHDEPQSRKFNYCDFSNKKGDYAKNILIKPVNNGIENSGHSFAFGDWLPSYFIKYFSKEGDLIYDPFMGTGTTAKAAHIYKRNWIGSEISQEYIDLANKRLEPYLTQQTLF